MRVLAHIDATETLSQAMDDGVFEAVVETPEGWEATVILDV